MNSNSSRRHSPLVAAISFAIVAALPALSNALSPPCDVPGATTAPCGPGPIWIGEGQSFVSCSSTSSGTIAFDAAAVKLRMCTGTAWVNIDTSATAVATPGGSDTQVQFNDGGSLGGDAGLTYNKTTDTLTGSVGSFATMTTSTKFYGANGTAANPAYVFTNATDTGVYLPATGILGLSVAGTERARVTSAGVSTTGYVSGTAFYSTDSNAYFYNNVTAPSLVMDSGNDFFSYTRSSNQYDFNIGGTSYVSITNTGLAASKVSSTNVSSTYISGNGIAVTGVVHGVSVATYFTAGTFNYIHPSNTVYLEVEVYGGGGAGGGTDGQNTAGTYAFSGGGGPGGYAKKWINNPSNTYVVTVGAGGAGVSAGGGNTGGTSSFVQVATSINVAATGGSGGGAETQSTGSVGASGVSGSGSGGDINSAAPGNRGYTRWYNSLGTPFVHEGGNGRSSFFGPGGDFATNATGSAGTNCSSGGGGVFHSTQELANKTGGAGAPGCLIIKAFY